MQEGFTTGPTLLGIGLNAIAGTATYTFERPRMLAAGLRAGGRGYSSTIPNGRLHNDGGRVSARFGGNGRLFGEERGQSSF